VTRTRVFAALGLLALIWGLWTFFPSRERQVKRQFKALSSWAAKTGEEGALASAQTARQAREFFADPCEWEAEAFNLSGRVSLDDLTRYDFALRTRLRRIRLTFYDLAVDFDPEGMAQVTATARIEAEPQEGGDTMNETHEIRCAISKTDGRWLIDAVTVVAVLRK
jgi:hypothetical protein